MKTGCKKSSEAPAHTTHDLFTSKRAIQINRQSPFPSTLTPPRPVSPRSSPPTCHEGHSLQAEQGAEQSLVPWPGRFLLCSPTLNKASGLLSLQTGRRKQHMLLLLCLTADPSLRNCPNVVGEWELLLSTTMLPDAALYF